MEYLHDTPDDRMKSLALDEPSGWRSCKRVSLFRGGESGEGGDLFKEFRQSVVNDCGRVKPLVVEEDKELLERKEWLEEFEKHLRNLSL
ncbi:hypothetical protein TorRG33x02_209720 [Trema orientale]|uniref:Uncharacterized protein n=1 Tax=Trema orientale TaxID=63057 RepID=A0A2P5ECK9_TREOI|nr:hypothetical protein TorRG33x02_209720 [Trema orientale]